MILSRDLADEMMADTSVIEYLKDYDIAKEFYAALCNTEWKVISTLPEDEKIIEKLKGVTEELWSCSWRFAGGIVAEIRDINYNTGENYMDFYCMAPEGHVSLLVRECFERMGWKQHL